MSRQRATLATMFMPAGIKSPLRNKSKVSPLKDEKVLNPPQNPIAMKSRHESFSILESEDPKNNPSRSELTTLEVRVPYGKFEGSIMPVTFPVKNLVTEPSPPPAKMSSTSFISTEIAGCQTEAGKGRR